jgi:very-short-patch-repair endonuclease
MSHPLGMLGDMTSIEMVQKLMERQYGLIAHEQAVAAGFSDGQTRRRLRSRQWLPVRPGVYAAAGCPPSYEQAVLAVILAIGGSALASHEAAGFLSNFAHLDERAIEVSTELPRVVRLEGVVAHRSSLLFDEDRTVRRLIPSTSPARTIVDMSGRIAIDVLGRVLDDQLRHGLRLIAVHRCIGRLPPAPGRRPSVIHALLATRLDGYDPGDSDLETKVLRWLVSAGLVPPRQQFRVRLESRKCKIDLAYPELKIAIELDGWDTHRTRSAFDDDRARANALVLAGWIVLRFTSRSTAEEVVEAVRVAFVQRLAA